MRRPSLNNTLYGRAAAGVPFDEAVPSGSAIRILTGAQLPKGVDTVVLEEDVTLKDGKLTVELNGKKVQDNLDLAAKKPKGKKLAEKGKIDAAHVAPILARISTHAALAAATIVRIASVGMTSFIARSSQR